ncbi:actin-related protein 8-like [Humulus lupulus]|uniref:actin-related protein 8-like n=1 Tax=Humulus lupulus TaxID=3486 RepID=UPI002B41421A|nr:actin-related protein 8-like [Humulus lupulus]
MRYKEDILAGVAKDFIISDVDMLRYKDRKDKSMDEGAREEILDESYTRLCLLYSCSMKIVYWQLGIKNERNSYEDYKSRDKKDVEIESFELAVLQVALAIANMEFGNIESPMYTRLRQFFSTIYSRMQVRAPSQPVVVSIPILHYDDTESAKASRRQLKEAIYTTLFNMNVPAVCAINQATLALYAARRTSGIVVNIGFQVTSVVPILHGKVMHKVGVEVVGLGALKLTGFLKELMQQNNISFESLYTVRTLKDNLCYVAYDYEVELLKDTRASSDVEGEGQFTLSKERFQTGEILFQPRMAGV